MSDLQNPSILGFQKEMPFQRGFQNQAPGFSEWQLTFNDLLEEIEHALRGEFYDTELKDWVTIHTKVKKEIKTPLRNQPGKFTITVKMVASEKCLRVKPLLNDDGIHDLLRDLRYRLNKNIIMTNWTERQISIWLWDLSDDLADKLFLMIEKWEIKFEDLDTIMNLVMLPTSAVVNRALDEGERRRMYEATKTTEIRDISQQEQRKGILDGLLSLGRK